MINGCIFCICVFALLYFLAIITGAGAIMNGCICLVVFLRDYDWGWYNDVWGCFFYFCISLVVFSRHYDWGWFNYE